MGYFFVLLALNLLHLTRCQKAGHQKQEKAPPFSMQMCESAGSCKDASGTWVMDSNWRWARNEAGKNCYTGNLWDNQTCATGQQCADNCYLEGEDYKSTYGIDGDGKSLKLNFITKGQYSTTTGSRLYPLTPDGQYQMFELKNRALSFDIDVSNIPCGINSALYFTAMEANGGVTDPEKAGAKYGVGYCDAQCPNDLKWINGKANSEGWIPSKTNPDTGRGPAGNCCAELDVWEGNSISQAFTAHPCSVDKPTVCLGDKCGFDKENRYNTVCDKDGCDFASYRYGAKDFYGKGKTIDTSKVFTVTTEFVTKGNTDDGELVEIRRSYVQDGKVIQNAPVPIPNLKPSPASITTGYCDASKKFSQDPNDFAKKGGMAAIDKAMSKKMVMVVSFWDDEAADLNWLDGVYPPNASPNKPGVLRGTCKPEEGKQSYVRSKFPEASVTFSNFKLAPIGAGTSSTSSRIQKSRA